MLSYRDVMSQARNLEQTLLGDQQKLPDASSGTDHRRPFVTDSSPVDEVSRSVATLKLSPNPSGSDHKPQQAWCTSSKPWHSKPPAPDPARADPRAAPPSAAALTSAVPRDPDEGGPGGRWCPSDCNRFLPVMGNGASASSGGSQVTLDGGESLDLAKVKALVPELRQQLKQRDAELERLQAQLQQSRQALVDKDSELNKLRGEVHKLKSVLQVTVHKDGNPDILSIIQEEATMAGQETGRTKKQGVSGESSGQANVDINLKRYDKDFRSVLLLEASSRTCSHHVLQSYCYVPGTGFIRAFLLPA